MKDELLQIALEEEVGKSYQGILNIEDYVVSNNKGTKNVLNKLKELKQAFHQTIKAIDEEL